MIWYTAPSGTTRAQRRSPTCTCRDNEFSDVDRRHLLEFADRHDIPAAKATIERVNAAVDSWAEHAADARLASDAADRVAQDFRTV